MNIRTLAKSVDAHRAVLGFSGWPDAGKLIEFTLNQLKILIPHNLGATWDLDGYWHADSIRPQITVRHGQIQQMEWPSFDFFVRDGRNPKKSVVFGNGPEPSVLWKPFARELVGTLKGWGCREILLLGSLLDQVFHDEVVISAVVQDPESYNKVRELGCELIEYNGPSAIHSAIVAEAQESNIRCISFWAHLPFYLSGPHEMIAAELLRILASFLGTELPTDDLKKAWQKRKQQIEQMLLQDQSLRQALESIKKQKVMSRSGLTSKVVHFEDFLKRRNDPEQGEE